VFFTTTAGRAFGVLAISAALVLPACSSSGGSGDSGVTTQQIADKLRKDPNVTALKSQLGDNVSKFNDFIECVAGAMKKDIKQSDLKAYLTGDKKLDSLATSKDKVATDARTCAKQVGGSG
jgi:uncharacterized protein YbcV (DUF1398 family)